MPENILEATPQAIVQPVTNPRVVQVTHQILRHEHLGDLVVFCDPTTGSELAIASEQFNLVSLAVANAELHGRLRVAETKAQEDLAEIEKWKSLATADAIDVIESQNVLD